jgi:HEAT repeat protein
VSELAARDPQQRLVALEEAARGSGRDAAILAGLRDTTTLVRERAVALAARHLQPELLGRLLADDADAVVRNAALVALERQGPFAVPHLLQLTLSSNHDVALFAVQILSAINDASAKQALLPLVDHPDPNIAQAAVEALGNAGAVEAVPALIRLLGADPWLQFAAVSALGKIGDGRVVAPLVELLDDELVAELAAEALGRIGESAALPALLERLAGDDRLPLRDHLLRAVAAIIERRPRALTARLRRRLLGRTNHDIEGYLRGLLVSDDTELGRAAATLVVRAGLWALLPELLPRGLDPEEGRWLHGSLQRCSQALAAMLPPLCAHPDSRVRQSALSLAPLPVGAVATVTGCLGDPDGDVRAAACLALGRLRDPGSAGVLRAALHSPHAGERAAAAQALVRLPAAALEVLGEDLQPGSSAERIEAALGILEQAGQPVHRERVLAFLDDARPGLRRAALRVLARQPGRDSEARILACLDDEDTAVRVAAVEGLVHRRCRRAIPRLVELLALGGPLSYHLIRALGRLRARRAAPRLIALYPEAPVHERIEIVVALNQMRPCGLLGFLSQVLAEPDLELRRVASDGFVRLAGAGELDELEALAADADWAVRNHAAWGLGRLGLPEARPTLVALARDVEPLVARTARSALGKLAGGAGT